LPLHIEKSRSSLGAKNRFDPPGRRPSKSFNPIPPPLAAGTANGRLKNRDSPGPVIPSWGFDACADRFQWLQSPKNSHGGPIPPPLGPPEILVIYMPKAPTHRVFSTVPSSAGLTALRILKRKPALELPVPPAVVRRWGLFLNKPVAGARRIFAKSIAKNPCQAPAGTPLGPKRESHKISKRRKGQRSDNRQPTTKKRTGGNTKNEKKEPNR